MEKRNICSTGPGGSSGDGGIESCIEVKPRCCYGPKYVQPRAVDVKYMGTLSIVA